MISIEKLKNVKRLVTHANCPDGYASALIIKDALPDVEVLFMAHGTKEHRELVPEPGMMFCDFTPFVTYDTRTSQLDELLVRVWLGQGALLLDHHPTQRDLTMKFVEAGLGAYGENDRNECGAWLAYEHVWLPIKLAPRSPTGGPFESVRAFVELAGVRDSVRAFAELAGVRDTWKKNDPRWQQACEQAEELMFWGEDELDLQNFIVTTGVGFSLGKVLFKKKLEHARKSIGESHRFQTQRGTRVLVFQGVTPTSDAAELLEKDWDERERYGGAGHYQDGDGPTDIVAGFHYRVDAGRLKLQFSTRSHTGYDVGAFCKAHGGGGHTAAAGFTVEQSPEVGANPYAVFRLLLEEWESGR